MSSIQKNLVTLITGNAIALALPVCLYPLMSRIFTPADYAVYGVYFSVFTFLEIASVGRYDFTVVMPKEDVNASNIVGGGILIAFFYSSVVLVLVFFFGEWLSLKLNSPQLSGLLYVLPPVLFIFSINKMFNSWLIRKKAFRSSSTSKVVQKLSEVIFAVSGGLMHFPHALIFADSFGRFCSSISTIYQSAKSTFQVDHFSWHAIRENLTTYSDFPKYSILPSFLNTLGGMIPVFAVSSFYTTEITGSFNFSRTIMGIPFALVSSAISQVLMQQISEKKNNNMFIHAELSTLAKKLFVLALAGMIPTVVAGPALFSFIFGTEWELAGELTRILVFSYCISFIVSPFSVVLFLLGRIAWISAWQITYFALVCLVWLANDFTINQFLIILVCFDIFAYGIYGFLIHRAVQLYERDLKA